MDYGLTFDGAVALSQTGDDALVFNNAVYLEASVAPPPSGPGGQVPTLLFMNVG